MNKCDCSTDYFDGEELEAQTTKIRVARKIHRCCECGHPIYPGENYEFVKGLIDGYWVSFKTCASCLNVRYTHTPCSWIYEYLWETIGECMGYEIVPKRMTLEEYKMTAQDYREGTDQ